MERNRQTKLAQNSQSDAPADTVMPSGVDTPEPEFVRIALFMPSVLFTRTVQITTPMNKRPEPKIANKVESIYVYVRFGMPVNMASAAQILPNRSR